MEGEDEVKPQFDEAKLSEMIKKGVQDSLKEAIATQQTTQQTTKVEDKSTETDPFDAWLNPKIDTKVASATLAAQSAEDKADFYSSEFWLTEVDEHLLGDTPEELKAAKTELRKSLESTFTNMIKQGRGTPRADLVLFEIGKYNKANKGKIDESITKRSKAKQEAELEKARRGVDIGVGALSNFQPQDVHGMKWDDIAEKYGQLAF